MKKIILIVLMFIFMISIVNAVPRDMNIQIGKLFQNNAIVEDSIVEINFSLWDASTGGSPIFTIEKNISINNGTGDVIIQPNEEIFINNSKIFLSVTIGTDSESLPRINLTSVPYAIRSNISDSVRKGIDLIANNVNATNINISKELVVIGSVSTFGSLNATYINATEILVNGFVVNRSIDLTPYQLISNVSKLPFSNFQLSNVSNNTLVKGDNASISLWNISGSNIFPRHITSNVGIGTTSLSTSKLTIDGDSSYVRVRDDAATKYRSEWALWGGSGAGFFIDSYDDVARVYLPFYFEGNPIILGTPGESNGNVGIGTASPAHKLHVIGNINATGSINATRIEANEILVNGFIVNRSIDLTPYQMISNVTALPFSNFQLSNVSNNTAWTSLHTYPSACSASQYISTFGDTLTCTDAPFNSTENMQDAVGSGFTIGLTYNDAGNSFDITDDTIDGTELKDTITSDTSNLIFNANISIIGNLNVTGAINATNISGGLNWNFLNNVPAGFADGIDDTAAGGDEEGGWINTSQHTNTTLDVYIKGNLTSGNLSFTSNSGFIGRLLHTITAIREWTFPDASGTVLLKEQVDTEAEFDSLLFNVLTTETDPVMSALNGSILFTWNESSIFKHYNDTSNITSVVTGLNASLNAYGWIKNFTSATITSLNLTQNITIQENNSINWLNVSTQKISFMEFWNGTCFIERNLVSGNNWTKC